MSIRISWKIICQKLDRSLIDLKRSLHIFLFFFFFMEDGATEKFFYFDNKLSDIFLCPRVWLFISWYEKTHFFHFFLSQLSLRRTHRYTYYLWVSRKVIRL